MRLFSKAHTEITKEFAGKPYRPNNAAEREWFFSEECAGCVHQSDYEADIICDTEDLSFWISKQNEVYYPAELQYGTDGQPCCRRKTLLPGE